MTRPFSTARRSATFRALLFSLPCTLLLLAGCDSSESSSDSEEISPDVLDVHVEPEQGEGNDPFFSIELTNTADRGLFSASVDFRLWNGSTRVFSRTSLVRDLPPSATFTERFQLIELDDISDFECFTYHVSVTPFVNGDQEGIPTEKDYSGTCPDDHPANRTVSDHTEEQLELSARHILPCATSPCFLPTRVSFGHVTPS